MTNNSLWSDSLQVLKGLRTFLVLLSCLHLSVGGTGLLQILAWSRMLVNFSATAGLAHGVAMTFDGQHPCRLCKALAAADNKRQKDEPEESPELAAMKFALGNLLPSEANEPLLPHAVDFLLPGFVPVKAGHSIPADSPPVPPPQGLLA
ncbi:MAG: hypothetical protein ABI162_09085 [Luteolibacter sp.]